MTRRAREEKDLQPGDMDSGKLGPLTYSTNLQAQKSANSDNVAYPPPLEKIASRTQAALPTDGGVPMDRAALPPQNAIICEFAVDDPHKPTNFSSLKKARITALAVVFAILTGEQEETRLFGSTHTAAEVLHGRPQHRHVHEQHRRSPHRPERHVQRH